MTIDWDALRTGVGVATVDYGDAISAAEARRWACDAKIIPVVLGGTSEPLDVGRALRTVPLAIRRALVARDRGCAFRAAIGHRECVRRIPGGTGLMVGKPVSTIAYYYVKPTPARVSHRWEILIHHGHVEFIPPAIIDPTRTPLHNPLRC